MPFRYEAYNREGQRVRGTLEVESEQAAEQLLWDKDLSIIDISKVGRPFSLHEQLPSVFGVRTDDVISFANQMAFLIEAGINIYAALQMMRDQTTKPAFREVLAQVVKDIGEGFTFSEALGRHPTAFSLLFVRLIKVGEETGRIDAMLRKVAGYMERRRAANAKVKSSLGYPLFVVVMAGISMYILLTLALPNLVSLFKEFGADMPLPTRIVIGGANFAGQYGRLMGLGLLAFVALAFVYTRNRTGARRMDYLLISAPVVGPMVHKLNLARLADTLESLIGGGLPLTEALDLLLETTQNAALREPLEEVRNDVLSGLSLSQAMARHAIFPPLMINLTHVGEEAGTMEISFRNLGRHYNEEADRTISSLIGFLEPALIVVVGLTIGLVAITIITTIYSVLPAIR
ncbi:MAG: type II secretion system F family protein [Chloroflexi bacterium]|nr:type II secretion system F family protein [Chloroflexota bacterium]